VPIIRLALPPVDTVVGESIVGLGAGLTFSVAVVALSKKE